jgi:hypothetical protein
MTTRTKVALMGFTWAALILAGVVASCAQAGEATLHCTVPSQFGGINWLYGAAPDSLIPLATTPTCDHVAQNLSPGMWYFAAKAFNTTGESPLSNIVSKEIAAPPPPTVLTLKTVGGEVYNTGSFDPVAWLVRKNKLYGTIAADVACDAARPAKDGWYRVSGASVAWTNPRARTSYPLAKCELR